MKCSLDSSDFLQEISSLSIVFLYFVALFIYKISHLSLLFSGTLHSGGCIFPFLYCSSLLFFTQLFASLLDNHFAFRHFIFFRMVLVNASCTMLWASIHSSSGTLSTRSNPWIYSSPPLYNHKGFALDHIWMAWWFSLLSSISLNFAIRSWWSEPQSAPGLVFADFIDLLHLGLQSI